MSHSSPPPAEPDPQMETGSLLYSNVLPCQAEAHLRSSRLERMAQNRRGSRERFSARLPGTFNEGIWERCQPVLLIPVLCPRSSRIPLRAVYCVKFCGAWRAQDCGRGRHPPPSHRYRSPSLFVFFQIFTPLRGEWAWTVGSCTTAVGPAMSCTGDEREQEQGAGTPPPVSIMHHVHKIVKTTPVPPRRHPPVWGVHGVGGTRCGGFFDLERQASPVAGRCSPCMGRKPGSFSGGFGGGHKRGGFG